MAFTFDCAQRRLKIIEKAGQKGATQTRIMQHQHHNNSPALWGGIECTINRVQNSFFDQLDYAGHYHRPGDIDLLAGVGIQTIRYPILWEKHQPQKDGPIDWQWTATQLQELQNKNIEVIAGLVHHGSGPAFTDLLDENFPYLLAAYAEKVARRFPFLNYFTPVNEPLTTARFSGLYGLWYPHKGDDASFLKMLLNELKGVVLSMQAIRRINPHAKLVQTEDLGKTYSTRSLQYQADFENQRRWLTYDLLCGRVTREHPLWKYLITHAITEKEILFFRENVCIPDIFGFNHYLTSERYLDGRLNRYPPHTHGGNGIHSYADVEAVRVDLKEKSGIKNLLKEAWERYRRPMAITEVHLHCHREDQLRWFQQVWQCCHELVAEGIQIKGVTAWAMLGSYGWNRLLTQPGGLYEPGVFDVRNGQPRPTALAAFLKSVPHKKERDHLLADAGWWQRPNRFFQPSLHLPGSERMVEECSAPLLIIGRNGSLGKAFARICKDRFLRYKLLSRHECDLCDPASIQEAISTYRPWAIVNAAGFAGVDEAEREQEKCFDSNTTGALNLAVEAAQQGIRLVTFSTDLVFDGKKGAAYVEDDRPQPINTYGLSKRQAEKAVLAAHPAALVIRTSAIFSPWEQTSFPNEVRRGLMNEEILNVANDAVISPTFAPDLVHATLDLLIDKERGIWHLTNNGEWSWVDFANEIADRFNLNRKYINPVASAEFNFAARRPLYTALTSSRGILLPSLDDALRRYTENVKAFAHKEKQLMRTTARA